MSLCHISFLFHYLLSEKEATGTGLGLSAGHLGGTRGTLQPVASTEESVWDRLVGTGKGTSQTDQHPWPRLSGGPSRVLEHSQWIREEKMMLQSPVDANQTFCLWGWVPKPLLVLPKAECRNTTQVSITNRSCLSYCTHWQSHRGQKSKICQEDSKSQGTHLTALSCESGTHMLQGWASRKGLLIPPSIFIWDAGGTHTDECTVWEKCSSDRCTGASTLGQKHKATPAVSHQAE